VLIDRRIGFARPGVLTEDPSKFPATVDDDALIGRLARIRISLNGGKDTKPALDSPSPQ
jgi:hypothetical protein